MRDFSDESRKSFSSESESESIDDDAQKYIALVLSLNSIMPSTIFVKSIEDNVSIRDFEYVQHIKSGGFGEVFLAMKKTTADIVAIKKINYKYLEKKNLFKFITIESEILNNIDNSYMVRCYYSFTDFKYIYFVMEYLSGGDLELYLKKGKFKYEVAF